MAQASLSLVFDLPELLERCLNDRDFAIEMLEIFVTQSPILLARLEETLERGDATEAAKAAHSLKGTAGNLAAKLLQPLAADIEKRLRHNDLSGARDVWPRLNESAQTALAEVPPIIKALKAQRMSA